MAYWLLAHCCWDFYPTCLHVQGVKQSFCLSVVCLSVVVTKITRLPHLGIWVTLKYGESVEIGDKLASLCFESIGKAHKYHKCGVFIGHAYRLQAMCYLLMPTRRVLACNCRNCPISRFLDGATISMKNSTFGNDCGSFWKALPTWPNNHRQTGIMGAARLWEIADLKVWNSCRNCPALPYTCYGLGNPHAHVTTKT